jgi:hypothetical protein
LFHQEEHLRQQQVDAEIVRLKEAAEGKTDHDKPLLRKIANLTESMGSTQQQQQQQQQQGSVPVPAPRRDSRAVPVQKPTVVVPVVAKPPENEPLHIETVKTRNPKLANMVHYICYLCALCVCFFFLSKDGHDRN